MTVALADLLIRLLTPWQPPVRGALPPSSLALDVDAQPSAAAELVRPLPDHAEMRKHLLAAGFADVARSGTPPPIAVVNYIGCLPSIVVTSEAGSVFVSESEFAKATAAGIRDARISKVY